MSYFADNVKVATATIGTGTVNLGVAANNAQTFSAAGIPDQAVVNYRIDEGTAWEIGQGTYSATANTLTRTPIESSNAGAAISLNGGGIVQLVLTAKDMKAIEIDRWFYGAA